MSQLLSLIMGQLNDSHIEAIGQKIGADATQTKSAVESAIPLLLGAMTNSANSNTSLGFLSAMLDKNHDGSIVDDVFGMISGSGASTANAQGTNAVSSILGDSAPAATEHVAQASGLDTSAIAKLLPLLAPIVMGALAKAQVSQNLSGAGLASFLEKENTSIASSHPQAEGFFASMLDKNHDGSAVDDVVQMGLGALGKMFKS